MTSIQIFTDIYIKKIIFYDLFYKLLLVNNLSIYGYILLKFSDFFKYDTYIFSRFYRNIRLNFVFFNVYIYKLMKKYLNNRKRFYFLNLKFLNFSGFNFYLVFEFLLFVIFKIFSKYKLSLYLYDLKKSNKVKIVWSDIYSNILDLNDNIVYKDLFLFKFDLPKIIYSIYIYIHNIEDKYKYLYISFFGIKYFFKKKMFNFKFYSRIV